MKPILVLLLSCAALLAADGRQEEQRSCLPCHSLRLIHSQRLSRAAWSKELDKMSKWGAKVQDREALLDYLVANFGNDKPAVPDGMSGDGSGTKGAEKR